ncbi:MAG: transketolase [Candidatus Pacebacteria bacterium]|nr:transketolase [Candidatus Paceibacterota bacterium]
MMSQDLLQIAQQLRIKVIKMLAQAGSGHPASALGLADLFALLYFGGVLQHRPDQPNWPQRDYLLMSNGHACPILYATLAQAGYFAVAELKTLRKLNSRLQGHPHYGSLPGIENSSGLLGQGLGQACGLSLSLKIDNQDNQVYCLMSDAEQQQGSTWEAYMLAAKYQLNNLVAIIDRNHIQISNQPKQVMPIEPLQAKLTSFNWQVYQVDGHDFTAMGQLFARLTKPKQPTAIILHTTAGKGVSFMENNYQWHGQVPNQQQTTQALKELNAGYS